MRKKILVVRSDHLGDLILTTPLFRALSLAGHQVEVVARKAHLPTLEGNPYVEGIHALEKVCPRFPKGWWVLSRWIRQQSPDIVLLPHARPASLLYAARCGGARTVAMWGGAIARILGIRSLRSGLPGNRRHISDIWLDLARALAVNPAGLKPEVFLDEEEKRKSRVLLTQRFGNAPVVVVHPGCAGNTCNLPVSEYALVVEGILATTDLSVILSGSPSERQKFEPAFAKFDQEKRVWNSMGKLELREFCAVLSVCRALISVGTGPLHLASALGLPTLSPFCHKPGVCAEVWGNLGSPARVILPPKEVCESQACGDAHCDFKNGVGAGQILSELRLLLENTAS